jgi:hypothetical protein
LVYQKPARLEKSAKEESVLTTYRGVHLEDKTSLSVTRKRYSCSRGSRLQYGRQVVSSKQDVISRPRVLVAEANVVLALDLESILATLGCQIVGPFATAHDALDALDNDLLDIALIDFHVRGAAEPLSAALDSRGIPYALCTGRSDVEVSEQYPNTPILGKPYTSEDVSRVVDSLIAARLANKR